MEALQRLHNRGSISTGYDVDNSLKFEAANSENLQRAAVTGNQRTFTQSCWLKRTSPGLIQQFICYGSFHEAMRCFINSSDDRLYVDIAGTPNALYRTITNRKFRDPSAWYHIVIAIDTTQSTEANRLKIYVNGVQETSFASQSLPPQNFDTLANIASSPGAVFGNMAIGALPNISLSNRINGYLAEAISIDGQALDPTSFGEFDEDSGIWKPIDVSGLSFGNNGYYLDFKDSSNLGNDVSGGTDFTLNNITSADQATDTPTNNFATGNPLGPFRVGHWNFTEGATYAQYAGGNDWGSFTSTIAVGSGKWYVEIQAGGSDLFVGAGSEDFNFVGAGNGSGFPEIYYGYTGTNSVGYHANNGNIYNNGSTSAIGSTYTTNDIISVALDMDNGKIYFAKNGTYMNSQNPATGANSIALPDTSARYFIGGSSYGTGKNHRCNYGGYTSFTISSSATDENGYGTFEYAPPSGYYALCTKNLEEFG